MPFLDGATKDGPFTRADGSTVSVPMMQADSEPELAYARGPGWQAVDLPYDGGGLAMAVVVPDAGRLDEVVKGFDATSSAPCWPACNPPASTCGCRGGPSAPRCCSTTVLAELGMPTAFTTGADFTGMTRSPDLEIAAVVHEAFIAVDEQGTEAAAATAVVMRATSARTPECELTVDRPFLFVLHDTATGTPLFIGRVSDPSARVTARRTTEPQKNSAATPNSHQFSA